MRSSDLFSWRVSISLLAVLFASAPLLSARTESVAKLSPTGALPDATGVAKLEVGQRGDPAARRIEIDARRLVPGVYTVTVYPTGGGSVTLGRFRVGREDNDRARLNRRKVGEAKATFLLDPTDEPWQPASIFVAAESGVHVLVGQFAETGSSPAAPEGGNRLWYQAPVTPGVATEATGFAEVKGRSGPRGATGQFRLEASGLPPGTFIILNVNGEDVSAAQTDGGGRLRVRMSAREIDILSISTVSIRDESGEELAWVQF